ncbi:MAG: nucleoside-diphosphate kinase [Bacteroidetes bacterium]|nr:nucleoside-diphosphate kinase [Bacteroidota bacterium]
MSTGIFTLALIKPNAVKSGYTAPILAKIHEAGFRISAMKFVQLTVAQAEIFYSTHKGQPFYDGLLEFMTSGPIVAAIIEKENAVEEYRKILGNTDPRKAAPGTLRHLFGTQLPANAVHGSDSDEAAIRECSFFFSAFERY